MSRILVEIKVPVTQKNFEAFISSDSLMSEVISMLVQIMNDMNQGNYRGTEDAILCNAETGIIYNVNMRIAELEIKNGDQLILI